MSDFDKDRFLLLNLQFFADDGEEKTEQPTAKRMEKAIEEGQFAKSPEIATAFLFIFGFTALKASASNIYNKSMEVYNYTFSLLSAPLEVVSAGYMVRATTFMLEQIIAMLTPIWIVALAVGLITNFAQVGWHPSLKRIKPKFSKIKPKNPIKIFFSKKALVELIKSLLKLFIISFAFYGDLKREAENVEALMNMDFLSAMSYIGNVAVNLGIKTGFLMIIVAALDYAYNLYTHKKSLKMTKHSVKEEFKQTEGDPLVKGKIRSKMYEAHTRRMMSAVPNADVVITNPTHFAVALKYDKQRADAPYVSAKGADLIAKRIKEIAKENNVEIVENRQLARALYYSTDVDQVIPSELYQAVAEVLAFVYNIKNKRA